MYLFVLVYAHGSINTRLHKMKAIIIISAVIISVALVAVVVHKHKQDAEHAALLACNNIVLQKGYTELRTFQSEVHYCVRSKI